MTAARTCVALSLCALTAACAASRPGDAYWDDWDGGAADPGADDGGLLPVGAGGRGAPWSPSKHRGDPRAPLRGRYLSRLLLSAAAQLPIEGAAPGGALSANVQVVAYSLFTARDGAQPDALWVDERPCFVELRTDNPWLGLEVASGLVQQLPSSRSALSLDLEAGLWSRALAQVTVGWRGDAQEETMPREPSDPRLMNPDGDDLPGVSVTVRARAGREDLRCRVATVASVRARYTGGRLTDLGLSGADVLDEGSSFVSLPPIGEDACPEGLAARLTGPHRVELVKLDADAPGACGGWTLRAMASLFRQ